MEEECFHIIIGKVVYGGLDPDGNIHIILKNGDQMWTEIAARFLKSVEGNVVKVRVSLWERRSKALF